MPELQELGTPQAELNRPEKKNQVANLALLILVLLGLLLFYWILTRPPVSVDKKQAPGINHLFSIYGIDRKDFLSDPNSVYIHTNGDIYVADTGNNRVVIFDSRGRFKSQISSKGNKLALGQLMTPLGVTVDSKNRIYTASLDSGVMVFNQSGKLLKQFRVRGIQLHTKGDRVYVTGSGSILAFDSKFEIVQHIGRRGKGLGQLESPQDVTIDDGGNLIVSDSQNMRIQIFDKKGEVIKFKGKPPMDMDDADRLFGLGTGLTQDDMGRIYIADALHHTIRIFDSEGNDFGEVGAQGDADGLFNYPSDISYISGNTFAIADKWNDRVQIVRINAGEAIGGDTEAEDDRAAIPLWAYVVGLLILLAIILLLARRWLARRRAASNMPPLVNAP